MGGFGGGGSVYYRRLMVFVDGTNILTELWKYAHGPKPMDEMFATRPPDTALALVRALIDRVAVSHDCVRIRNYWFGSYSGDDGYSEELHARLREHGFEPVLFKRFKSKGGKEKGVDIALTKEMLVNAFHRNFDSALLVAGDEDYLGLVNEVKRYGGNVWGAFLSNGLSAQLRLAFDTFFLLDDYFQQQGPNTLLHQLRFPAQTS